LSCGDATGPDDAVDVQIHAGSSFTCALDATGAAWCWGRNNHGQLGDGTIDDRSSPVRVSTGLEFASLGIHGIGQHACAVTKEGDAYCWGRNDWSQLGDGTVQELRRPVAVAGGLRFKSVSAGNLFSCGLTEEGEAYCWGRGEWGNLGNGSTEERPVPTRVAGNLRFDVLKAGSSSLTCGVTTDGEAYCWGLNWRGELGRTTGEMCQVGPWYLACSSTPVWVPSPNDEAFRDISPGSSYVCATLVDDSGVCWGRNNAGQLGSETTEICIGGEDLSDSPCSRSPVPISGGRRFQTIAASAGHTCGITTGGETYCWGLNEYGQLGNGQFRNRIGVPVPVMGGHGFMAVTVGREHSCAATRDGEFYCWGTNYHGQIGNPDAMIQEFPIVVAPRN
jgi:alpha-tubulin suppressor-like RCC1 family protein